MRRVLFGLAVFLALALPAQAQDQLGFGPIITTNDTVIARLGPASSFSFQVTGTFSGTLTFQASSDCQRAYQTLLVTSSADGTTASSTTTTGLWTAANGGYGCVQVIGTSMTSGRAVVTVTRGYAQAKIASPSFTSVAFADGTVAAPSVTFLNEKTSGRYRIGLNNIGEAIAGVKVFDWNASREQFAINITDSGAHTLTMGGLITGAGVTTSAGTDVTSARDIIASAGGNIYWNGRSVLTSTANGLFNIVDNAGTLGPQINVGTAAPTPSACGNGAVTAHSTNFAGEMTNGSAVTACTVTFGAPNFTNTPFCVISVEASTVTEYISAISNSAFTVSALANSEKFMWVCAGGV